jgi:WD40 repeat protein
VHEFSEGRGTHANRNLLKASSTAATDDPSRPGYVLVLADRTSQWGRQIAAPLNHESGVMYVAFSAGGERLTTASDDKTARLWDARTGAGLWEPMRHQNSVRQLWFSPDSERMETAERLELTWLADVRFRQEVETI